MIDRSTLATLAVLTALAMATLAGNGTAVAQDTAAKETPKVAADEPIPKFDAAYLSNADNIKVGLGIWSNQCRHCHGNSAYPGKAPKLNPGAMEPGFIFDRVTNGFGKMPGWKEVFTLEERKGVVAYVKSNSFAP